jgi:hypothetical protein
LLEKKPEAVKSRNRLKKATPWLISGRAFFGQAMSSSTCRRCVSDTLTKSFPNRLSHSASSQARPPRMAVWPSGYSVRM